MDNKVFDACFAKWKDSNGYSPFWGELAKKFGYGSSELIRSEFKRERKRRGITRESITTSISKKTESGNASVCVFDLEFSPCVSYNFELFNINVGIDQIISHPYMLSWAAKELNDSEMHSDVLTSREAIDQDDFRIVKSLSDYLNDQSILIGHNIKEFDLKKLNVRLLKHGLPPLVKHQIVDTLVVARQSFSFPSASLKYINSFLKITSKIETEGFNLWKKCMNGDSDALATMLNYNQGDVYANEDLYFRLRPFVKGHPNLGLYHETCETRCPNCGSETLDECGSYFTPSGRFVSMRCKNCGAVSRKKQNELELSKRKSLLVA